MLGILQLIVHLSTVLLWGWGWLLTNRMQILQFEKYVYNKNIKFKTALYCVKNGPQLEVSAIPVQPVERFEQAQVTFPGEKNIVIVAPSRRLSAITLIRTVFFT